MTHGKGYMKDDTWHMIHDTFICLTVYHLPFSDGLIILRNCLNKCFNCKIITILRTLGSYCHCYDFCGGGLVVDGGAWVFGGGSFLWVFGGVCAVDGF